MHFHAPSEHTIGGAHYDAEIHFVHVNEDDNGKLLVVGVFFDTLAEDQIGSIFMRDFVLDSPGGEIKVRVPDLFDHMQEREFYHYSGSLTTPGCDEIVSWYVFNTPVAIDATDLEDMIGIFGQGRDTYRYTQDLNNREIYVGMNAFFQNSLLYLLAVFTLSLSL